GSNASSCSISNSNASSFSTSGSSASASGYVSTVVRPTISSFISMACSISVLLGTSDTIRFSSEKDSELFSSEPASLLKSESEDVGSCCSEKSFCCCCCCCIIIPQPDR